MRTSKVSQDTTRMIQALSTPRRQTRSSTATSQNNDVLQSTSVSLSSANTADIEDLLERPAKRRKPAVAAPPAIVHTYTTSRLVSQTVTVTSRRLYSREPVYAPEPPRKPEVMYVQRRRRRAAMRIPREDGFYDIQPPPDWETMYEIVKRMRAANPTAPVDTMGCAELHCRTSPPKDQRFQTLVALMLSSQTKDTVTAVAMQRLHTELGRGGVSDRTDNHTTYIKKEEDDEEDDKDRLKTPINKQGSTLTVQNILEVSPERLNELIRTVGFHNNKTKYIKQVASILNDQYDGDIPSTPEELMALPGVGPKMAYLCMSAAWGKHLGIGVDVHVHRITNLWGWHPTRTPEETRLELESWLPKDKWHEINKLLVGLGQTVCLPVKRRCGECDLAGTGLCKSEIPDEVDETKRKINKEAKVKIEALWAT